MKVLLVGGLREVQMLVGFASSLSKALGEVDALLLGRVGDNEARGLGVDVVYIAEDADPGYSDDIVGAVGSILASSTYDYIFMASSRIYKEAGSRIAQRIGAPAISEVTSAELRDGGIVFVRGLLAGKAVSREVITPPGVILVSPGRYGGQGLGRSVGRVSRIKVEVKRSVEILERRAKQRGSVRLEDAEIIVSVGRGFKSKEDLSLAFKLAELIGAQVGCSRPIAADLKWLPEEHWVGLSGKKVRPKLYIALGISGQPQHLAGIMDAKIIVAVNKDPNAPIFKYADYGIVEDLYQFVPKLIERIASSRK